MTVHLKKPAQTQTRTMHACPLATIAMCNSVLLGENSTAVGVKQALIVLKTGACFPKSRAT
jgi:hypothetical protein